MAKPSSAIPSSKGKKTISLSSSCKTTVSEDLPRQHAYGVLGFFESVGVSDPAMNSYSSKDFYSDIVTRHLKADTVQRGRVTCSLTVKPTIVNYFDSLHGGAVAAVAERVAIACARTVVAEEKELFLGELSISYLSAATENAELTVDGWVMRSGRNLTMVAIDFKMKKTGKLVYTARATFYNSPISKL